MRKYTVYFIIKRDGHGYMNQDTVVAANQKAAILDVKHKVRETTGKFAFSATCKAPEKTADGLKYNGMTYTKYSDVFKRLW